LRPRVQILLVITILFIVYSIYTIKTEVKDEEPEEYIRKRLGMVELLKNMGIDDTSVLDAMKKVPRHLFVPNAQIEYAYNNHPLPIGEGQTISQPYIVAYMTQSLQLDGTEKVLEIGTGSGYQAAILGNICEEVYSIEIIDSLAESSKNTLNVLGYHNIKVKCSDGYFGWSEHAPFDAIIITCAANHIPPPLIQQLKDGGKLILPLGSTNYVQILTLIEKNEEEIKVQYLSSVRFVPMTGEAQKKIN
jgi:protein-L-isoaspartate(D-aspartate) O-methyltransferase